MRIEHKALTNLFSTSSFPKTSKSRKNLVSCQNYWFHRLPGSGVFSTCQTTGEPATENRRRCLRHPNQLDEGPSQFTRMSDPARLGTPAPPLTSLTPPPKHT